MMKSAMSGASVAIVATYEANCARAAGVSGVVWLSLW
jgi:hypothetical protein